MLYLRGEGAKKKKKKIISWNEIFQIKSIYLLG